MTALEMWRQNPLRVPWYRPSWGALAAAAILDELDRPQEFHHHLNVIRL